MLNDIFKKFLLAMISVFAVQVANAAIEDQQRQQQLPGAPRPAPRPGALDLRVMLERLDRELVALREGRLALELGRVVRPEDQRAMRAVLVRGRQIALNQLQLEEERGRLLLQLRGDLLHAAVPAPNEDGHEWFLIAEMQRLQDEIRREALEQRALFERAIRELNNNNFQI